MKKSKGLLCIILGGTMLISGSAGLLLAHAENSVSLKTEDMIAAIVQAGVENGAYGKTISNELFSYSIGYGKVDAEKDTLDCNAYEISSGGLRTKAVYNSANYNSSLLLTTGTARITNYYFENDTKTAADFNIVYHLTALKDEMITITHDGRNNTADNLYANVYKKDANDITILQSHAIPKGDVTANSLGGTFELLEGEELIYEFALVSESLVDRVFYGALFPDFTAMLAGAFETEQSVLLTKLNKAKNDLAEMEADYKEADYASLVAIYNNAVEKVNLATEVSQLTTISEELETKVSDYFTTAAAATYKNQEKEKLVDYIENLDESLYLQETWQTIEQTKNKFENAIAEMTRKSLIDAEYQKIITEIVSVEKDAPVTHTNLTVEEIVTHIVNEGEEENGYSNAGENNLVSYQAGYGRIFSSLEKLEMNAFEIANGGLRTEKLFNTAGYNSSFILSAGKIRVTNNYLVSGASRAFNGNVILRFTAKDNLKITIKHSAGTALANMVAKTYKTEKNNIYLLKEFDMSADYTENAYGGEWTIKKGDTLYFEYSAESGLYISRDINVMPQFLFEVIEENDVISAIPSASDLPVMTNKASFELISEISVSGGGKIKYNGVTWQLLHGDIENAKDFEIVSSNILRTQKLNAGGYNSVYASNAENKYVRTDVANNEKLIYKFIADNDVKITINNDAWIKGSNSLGAYYECYLAHYDENANEWYYLKSYTKKVEWANSVAAEFLFDEINLTSGDILFYSVYGANQSVNVELLPTFTTDISAYDSEKAIDFEEYIAAQKAVQENLDKLQGELDGLSLEDYNTDDYLELCDLYDVAIAEIPECKTTDEIEVLVTTLTNKVNNYVKISEKSGYIDELIIKYETALGNLKESDYKTETWQNILNTKATLRSALNELNRKNAMEEVLNETINNTTAISKDNVKKGCSGTISKEFFIMMICFISIAVVVRKYKHFDDEREYLKK